MLYIHQYTCIMSSCSTALTMYTRTQLGLPNVCYVHLYIYLPQLETNMTSEPTILSGIKLIICHCTHSMQSGLSPLMLASWTGHTHVVDLLIKSGAHTDLRTVKVRYCTVPHV